MSLLLSLTLTGCDLFRRLPKDGEANDSNVVDTSAEDTDTAEDSAEDSGEPPDSGEPVVDSDGDGYTAAIDCDDGNADIHPGALDVDFDGWDSNCDGLMLDNGCVYADTVESEIRVWVYDRTSSEGTWVEGAPWATGVITEDTSYRLCGAYEFVVGHVLQINGIYIGADGSQGWLVGTGGASHITRVSAGNYVLPLEPTDVLSTPPCTWTDNGMGGGDLYCTVTYDTVTSE